MRILLLTTHLNVGGIPRYVINLAKFLARKNFVVVATSGGEWEKELVGVSNTVVQRSDSIKEKVLPISFSGYPVIGMISRLAPEKNISFFIQSMPLILKKYPEAVALILGEGREELRLKEIKKKLGLDGRVFFLKKLPSLVVLRNLDIFLSLTEGEPFGFSVVEAQYMGTPVVVANSGALKEIVEDRVTGIILKTTTPRDILEAIDLLLKDNDLRRRIVANAKKMVEERFSLEKMGKSTSQVYEEVLSQ